MPEYTHAHKLLIMAEQAMWNVVEILNDQQRTCESNEFFSKMSVLEGQARALARELRDYNDQFETEEE